MILERTCCFCLFPSIQIEGKQKKKNGYGEIQFVILAFAWTDLITIQQTSLIIVFPLKLIKINSSGYEQPLILVFYPRSFTIVQLCGIY